jgi:hypothetical protein
MANAALKSGARKNTQVKHTSTNVTGIPASDSQRDSVALAAIADARVESLEQPSADQIAAVHDAPDGECPIRTVPQPPGTSSSSN